MQPLNAKALEISKNQKSHLFFSLIWILVLVLLAKPKLEPKMAKISFAKHAQWEPIYWKNPHPKKKNFVKYVKKIQFVKEAFKLDLKSNIGGRVIEQLHF